MGKIVSRESEEVELPHFPSYQRRDILRMQASIMTKEIRLFNYLKEVALNGKVDPRVVFNHVDRKTKDIVKSRDEFIRSLDRVNRGGS